MSDERQRHCDICATDLRFGKHEDGCPEREAGGRDMTLDLKKLLDLGRSDKVIRALRCVPSDVLLVLSDDQLTTLVINIMAQMDAVADIVMAETIKAECAHFNKEAVA